MFQKNARTLSQEDLEELLEAVASEMSRRKKARTIKDADRILEEVEKKGFYVEMQMIPGTKESKRVATYEDLQSRNLFRKRYEIFRHQYRDNDLYISGPDEIVRVLIGLDHMKSVLKFETCGDMYSLDFYFKRPDFSSKEFKIGFFFSTESMGKISLIAKHPTEQKFVKWSTDEPIIAQVDLDKVYEVWTTKFESSDKVGFRTLMESSGSDRFYMHKDSGDIYMMNPESREPFHVFFKKHYATYVLLEPCAYIENYKSCRLKIAVIPPTPTQGE